MEIKLLQPSVLLLMAQSPTPFISVICSVHAALYLPSDFPPHPRFLNVFKELESSNR